MIIIRGRLGRDQGKKEAASFLANLQRLHKQLEYDAILVQDNSPLKERYVTSTGQGTVANMSGLVSNP